MKFTLGQYHTDDDWQVRSHEDFAWSVGTANLKDLSNRLQFSRFDQDSVN
jgi:hypothetical protein